VSDSKFNVNIDELVARYPQTTLGHFPTPLEPMPNLGKALGLNLYVKRDDCTGIGFGGNKVRQLNFYFGDAVSKNADTVLITGAVQSNFVRTTAAFAARLGMQCHVQLEERVANVSATHRNNGNTLLNELLGATVYSYPDGEDEEGADASLVAIAETLKQKGCNPYVIPLSPLKEPLGALGYVQAAKEFLEQVSSGNMDIDEIVVGSGSSLTHAGLLYGLKALGSTIPVYGICVRRDQETQRNRVLSRLNDLNTMLGTSLTFKETDTRTHDGALLPGYGQLNDATKQAIEKTAQLEGLFLDPVYTGKTMAGLMQLAEQKKFNGPNVVFWHTGGTPALFGYADQLNGHA